MARLWSCGFELQSTTSLMEWDTTTGSPSINTSTKRSGEAALRCNTTSTTAYISHRFRSNDLEDVYIRFYLYIATSPSVTTTISDYGDGSFQASKIRLRADRKLEVTYNNLTVSGTGTTVLNTGQWYRIEYYYDETNNKVTLKIDGNTELNAVSNNDVGGGGFVRFGVIDSATADLYFDDIAINDTSGSFQNSWAGAGSIVHLNPSAAGDNAAWPRAGTDSGANWSQANSVPPNDATAYLNRSSGQPIDDHKVQDPTNRGIGSSDTITLVAVGVRGGSTSNTANTGRNLNLRLKSASGGTLATATSIDFSINGWTTHSDPTPRVYKLTRYTDPTTGSAWTVTGTNSLTNMQIGVQPSASSTTVVRYTEVWALVEYVPSGGTIVYGSATLTGVGGLNAIGVLILVGGSTISGYGTLTTIGGILLFGNSNLSGIGSLTATGGFVVFGITSLSGQGIIISVGNVILGGVSNLYGYGTLTAEGGVIISGSLLILGEGNLASDSSLFISGSSAIYGFGNLEINGGLILFGTSYLSGSGELVTNPILIIAGTSFLYGVGTITSEGFLIIGGASSLSGIGDLSANGQIQGEGIVYGSSLIYGLGNLDVAGSLELSGSSSLINVGILTADGSLIIIGQISLSGIGIVNSNAQLIAGGGGDGGGGGGGVAGTKRKFWMTYLLLRRRRKKQQETEKETIKRSKSAEEFINELKEKIMETGIVENTHKPYHPRWNPRRPVSERQAARVAYSIAKKEGYRVGKYRGPNKK
jgi:hypothetical protein